MVQIAPIYLKFRQEHERTMSVHCPACGSRNLRPSRIQHKDLICLLALRHPVRCRYCRTRFCINLLKMRKVRREARAREVRRKDGRRMPQPVPLDQHRVEDFR